MIIPEIKSQIFTTPQNLFTLTAPLICPGPAMLASLLFLSHSQHTLASVSWYLLLLSAWNLSRVPPNSLFHITQGSAQMLLLREDFLDPSIWHLSPQTLEHLWRPVVLIAYCLLPFHEDEDCYIYYCILSTFPGAWHICGNPANMCWMNWQVYE